MTLRTILTLILMAVCVALGSGTALAHSSLAKSTPADGAVLQQMPDRVVLHFNEPISPLVLRLTGPGGEADDLKTFAIRHHAVEITPPSSLGQGSYALSWRVTSADGHPISGSIVFSIGAPGSNLKVDGIAASRSVEIGLWSARLLMYAGVFAGVGGAFFAAWIAGRANLQGATRRGIIACLWGGILATILSVGLQGLDALALPLQGLGDGAVWLQGLKTSFGLTAGIALLALTAALMSLMAGKRWQAMALSGAALAGIGLAFAASGHASTAQPQWLTRASVFVHVAGLAFWIGALAPLFSVLRRADPQGAAVMNRFSFAILPVVILLMVAGAILAIIQVGSPAALWSTAYGNILLLKLAVVGGLLGLAALNRVVFTPALARNPARQSKGFARSVAVEGVLVLLILGAVAGWRFTPPPRAIGADPGSAPVETSGPVTAHAHTDKEMAEIVLDPGQSGRTSMTIRLASMSGTPLNPKEVAVALSNPSSGIEPFERQAVRIEDGAWRIDNLVLPVAGSWQVRIDALVSDFEKVMLEGEIETSSDPTRVAEHPN